MKIYTKTGDSGNTSLLSGKRVKKNCIDIEAIGEIDELNTMLGITAAHLNDNKFKEIKKNIEKIQNTLFIIGSHIANAQTKIYLNIPDLSLNDIAQIENWIDEMEKDLENLREFIIPGGHIAAAHAFAARAVCRRLERALISLLEKYKNLNILIIKYINRLSDLLFVSARWINKQSGFREKHWKK